jgi:hypothetical protein
MSDESLKAIQILADVKKQLEDSIENYKDPDGMRATGCVGRIL